MINAKYSDDKLSQKNAGSDHKYPKEKKIEYRPDLLHLAIEVIANHRYEENGHWAGRIYNNSFKGVPVFGVQNKPDTIVIYKRVEFKEPTRKAGCKPKEVSDQYIGERKAGCRINGSC